MFCYNKREGIETRWRIIVNNPAMIEFFNTGCKRLRRRKILSRITGDSNNGFHLFLFIFISKSASA
jgi:hypothetical protein